MKYNKGTFVVVPNKESLKGKPSEYQSIFFWIVSHADENGICFPQRTTISAEAGCNIKTVDKYVKQLIEDGLVIKIPRKGTHTKRRASNMYQIVLLESTENGVRPDTENGSVTISNINSIHLTIPDTKVSENLEVKITLPLLRSTGESTGKTPTDRLLYLYSKLYSYTYETTYKPNWGRDKKTLNELLKDYSEIQLAYMFCVYFNWHGMTGGDDKEYNYYTSTTFPLTFFKSTINKYEVYIRNVLNYKFEDSELLTKVGEYIKSIS